MLGWRRGRRGLGSVGRSAWGGTRLAWKDPCASRGQARGGLCFAFARPQLGETAAARPNDEESTLMSLDPNKPMPALEDAPISEEQLIGLLLIALNRLAARRIFADADVTI